ncbi:taurine dioxygenase [Kwoniella heveanensis CBS 569]|nr:taurine dioxygenase [Kwoniella heveanensis CBS 569]
MPIALASSNPIDAIKAGVADVSIRPVAVDETFDLRTYSHFDATGATGTEFRKLSTDGKPTLSIRAILGNETRLKALGKLVSERGVVFFRDASISPEEQKELAQELGRLGGKPAESTLHVHPLTRESSELGDEITMISHKYVLDEKFGRKDTFLSQRPFGASLWHSDITFEPVPADYTTLQIRTLPPVGGDTLWASAYEAYDRLSPALQKFLESLTATHVGQGFIDISRTTGEKLRQNRGHPENSGDSLSAIHPVIRTNPVTGWKGLFVNRGFTKRINELNKHESDRLLEFLFEHIAANHDLQARFRWEENNLAIWDNRSVFHAATYDLDDLDRVGTRSVGVGEKPYFDPKSVSRRTALAQAATASA